MLWYAWMGVKEAFWFRFAFFSGLGTFRHFMQLASCFRHPTTKSSDAFLSLIYVMSFTEASYWGPFECLGMGVEALDCFRRGILVGRGHAGTLARWRTMGFAGHSTASDTFFFNNSMLLLNRILVVFTIEFY
jgi:hypothetical protein